MGKRPAAKKIRSFVWMIKVYKFILHLLLYNSFYSVPIYLLAYNNAFEKLSPQAHCI